MWKPSGSCCSAKSRRSGPGKVGTRCIAHNICDWYQYKRKPLSSFGWGFMLSDIHTGPIDHTVRELSSFRNHKMLRLRDFVSSTSWFRDKSIRYPRKQVTINRFFSTSCIKPKNPRTAGVQSGLKNIARTFQELRREVIFSVTNLSHLLLSHVKKCPKSSGRQDLNLRLLGPK